MFDTLVVVTIDDRTTKARIRDAAIEQWAANPPNSVTVRDIAAAAEVSPGSVIHHFGSMAELRTATNTHIAGLIQEHKSKAIQTSGPLDILGSLRTLSDLPITAYLARAVLSDDPTVASLVDELVDDAVVYLDAGVEAGTIAPSDHPRERATVLVLWTLGGLVLHQHMERLLGVDLTDPKAIASPAGAPYTRTALEIVSRGILTDEFAANLQESLDAAYGDGAPTKEAP
jgi:AcrR family transcriptional regulator